ncbi:hypothetical protein NY10_979 [Carnobacterium antarcticum]|nr:hypothetical protein NY10_979 [Carnobacterium sp. CP1]
MCDSFVKFYRPIFLFFTAYKRLEKTCLNQLFIFLFQTKKGLNRFLSI